MANIRTKYNSTPPILQDGQWTDIQVDENGRLLVSNGPSSDPGPIEALDGASATGASIAWPGGDGILIVNGTWDSASATLEYSVDDSVWYSLGADYSLSADGLVPFSLPSGYVRVAIANAGTTSLDAIIRVY